MNGSADVVIIGGGIVGISAAYFLTEAGVRDVVILERATVGAGATGRAAGVMLVQSGSDADLSFQLEAIAVHRRFCEEVGTDLRASGSLLLWRSDADAQAARDRIPFHADRGIRVEAPGPHDLRREFPYLAADDIVLGTHTSID